MEAPEQPGAEAPSKSLSTPALISLLALTLLGLIGGWMVLLMGGFYSKPGKFSHQPATFVSGPMALVMVTIEFAMSAIGVAAVLQAWRCSKAWQWFGSCAVLLPPLVFVLAGLFASD